MEYALKILWGMVFTLQEIRRGNLGEVLKIEKHRAYSVKR